MGRLAVLLVLCAAQPVAAQSGGPVLACRLDADAPAAQPVPSASRGGVRPAACPAAERTATFVVEYVGFPADARAAFQAAVDVWSCRIASRVPIRILATWEGLAPTTLGSAGPYLVRNTDGAPLRDTWIPTALANAFAGADLAPSDPDILGSFNRDFAGWHLDPTTPPPPDRYDFATVVLHEIGHGLGLIGALAVVDGLGYVGAPGRTRGPYAFDRWTEAGGVPLLDARAFPDRSVALATALRSTDVAFDGPAVQQATAAPARLYAPSAWDEGASYSHLDERTYAPATPDGLMTPFLARGEAIAEPGTAVCAMLADVGWRLAGDCAARVGARPDTRGGLAVERTGPNPVRRQTSVRVTPDVSARLVVTLVDALGRRVAVLADQPAEAGQPVDVVVGVSGLASGVYRVVVDAGASQAVVPVVVVR